MNACKFKEKNVKQIEVLSQKNEELKSGKKMLTKEISHTKKQNLYKRPKR